MLSDGEDDVGGGHERPDPAGDLVPDNFGKNHRDGLTEHHGLGLNATDTPAKDTQAVDHRRVRI